MFTIVAFFLLIFVVGIIIVWFILFFKLIAYTFTFEPNQSQWPHIRRSAFGWIALITPVAIIIVMAIVGIKMVRETALQANCSANMCILSRAMMNYYAVQGCFPPAYTVDPEGRPLMSWRVLLLPYLEQQQIYNQLHLDEPWNSRHNRPILEGARLEYLFSCPLDNIGKEGVNQKSTSYVMIVGPRTISDGPHSVREEDIVDGSLYTIMLIEIADSGIFWAEPRDLKADDINFRINDPEHSGISSHHEKHVNVAYCDGSIFRLRDSTDPKLVKALSTIAGGEDGKSFELRH
jgi:hypothetical protein